MSNRQIEVFIPKDKQLGPKMVYDANGKFITKIVFQEKGKDDLQLGQFYMTKEEDAKAVRAVIKEAVVSGEAVVFDAGKEAPDSFTPGFNKVTYLYPEKKKSGGSGGGRPKGYSGPVLTESQVYALLGRMVNGTRAAFGQEVGEETISKTVNQLLINWGNGTWLPDQ